MIDQRTLAYLAGAIDSDGTIGIRRSTYSMRKVGDSKQPVYSERVALRQVTAHVVELLHDTFGGSVYITKPSASGGRPLWSWSVTDMRATTCLRGLLPYLRVKQEQARNTLALREVKERSKIARVARGRGHVGSAMRPVELTDAMQVHYERAKKLNAVGAAAQPR